MRGGQDVRWPHLHGVQGVLHGTGVPVPGTGVTQGAGHDGWRWSSAPGDTGGEVEPGLVLPVPQVEGGQAAGEAGVVLVTARRRLAQV